MSNWLSWKESLKELELRNFEVIGLFPKGLQPYSPKGQAKIYCPPNYHLYWYKLNECRQKIHELNKVKRSENPDEKKVKELEKLVEKLEMEIRKITKRDPDCHSWEFLIPPNTDAGFEKLIHDLDLETAIFKRDNVEEIRRTFGLGDPKKIQDKISERSENLKAVFPCEPGAKWESVKITLVSDYTVDIITPRGSGRFSYRELGMADNRTRDKKPGLLWKLFILFAKNQGLISSQESEYDPVLPDTAKRLNKHLQNLSDIQESIFTGHYKAEKAYRTKIFFSDQT